MPAASPLIYFDTDAFHTFAETFKDRPLASDLHDKIVFSPVTLMEVFSHLAVEWGPLVHQQIKGLPNWIDKNHVVILPYMNDAIAKIAFGVPVPENGFTKVMQENMNVLLNCDLAEVLEIATARRDELSQIKSKYAGYLKDLAEYFRKVPLTDNAFTEIWFAGLKRRLHLESSTRSPIDVICALSAYYEFELAQLKIAVPNINYNFEKHRNDLFDVEQMIYLSDDNLHFLTIDGGYCTKVLNSPLRSKIHEVLRNRLTDPISAEQVLRELFAASLKSVAQNC